MAEQPILSRLRAPVGAVQNKRRIGRGPGSGLGTTGGKGQKGQYARAGGQVRRGFEGGQTPLMRRLPKVGFTNPFRKTVAIVNIRDLTDFGAGSVEEASVTSVLVALWPLLPWSAANLASFTYVSQGPGAGRAPLVMSKKTCWMCAVIVPRVPVPILMRSTERIGVISAAVPVKNSSSAT